jgi:hypothetical protein
LYLLQGATKDEMILPIASFNPMGKDLALSKVEALLELDAEQLVNKCLQQINSELEDPDQQVFKVAINLIDDVEGSWSNYAVTDYKNKFEFNGLFKRSFCTPIFWTSESFSDEKIIQRTKEYLHRTIYWIDKGPPERLFDCFEQEVYVNIACESKFVRSELPDVEVMEHYYHQHSNSTDYNLNLNFFYVDEQTKALNFLSYGVPKNGGFSFAKYMADKRREETSY